MDNAAGEIEIARIANILTRRIVGTTAAGAAVGAIATGLIMATEITASIAGPRSAIAVSERYRVTTGAMEFVASAGRASFTKEYGSYLEGAAVTIAAPFY